MERYSHANKLVAVDASLQRKTQRKKAVKLNQSTGNTLSQQLQTTLDIHELLNIFFKSIQIIVPVDCMRFNDTTSLDVRLGQGYTHSLSYQMTLSNQSLGEILFGRDKKFSKTEIEHIENAMTYLFYPLRNALQYHLAVNSALTDILTQCGNRRALTDDLDREIEYARRHEQSLSLLMIDADNFKDINDQYGHQVGDETLKMIGNMTKESLRQYDRVYRYGGEEFVVLLIGSDSDCAIQLAERMRRSIAASNLHIKNTTVSITVSIGISTLKASDEPDALFTRADEALYSAKRKGKNQVCLDTSTN